MKKYILFGLTLLMAFPVCVSAQDDDEMEEEEVITSRVIKKKQKKYDTRVVRGQVKSAITGQPVSGALVFADGIDGYSVLTEDDGSYQLNVPLFTTSVFVSSTDYTPVRMGLQAQEQQFDVVLYPTTFSAEYSKHLDARNDRSATDFKYTNSVNIKDEIQQQLGGQVYSINRNGTPGIGQVMFIQGLNSLNVNAQPLIVVDGVVYDQQ
jgi:type II secretory pathway pseudopilin PulG